MKARFRVAGVVLAILASFSSVDAQDFPNRPVRFIVPYAPGGSGDLLARLLSDELAKIWGQQPIVDNRPGAGGLIGTEAAAHSPADGYTIYLATDGPITIAPTLHKKPLPYDWKRDFVPITMIGIGYQILLLDRQLAVTSLGQFVDLARASPGKYNFASIGVGSPPQMGAELFLSLAGIKLTHVPYRGSSQQAISALIAGDVSMFVVGTSTALPFVQAGTVSALSVSSPRRLDSLPDVPTFFESGYPEMDYKIWFAVFAPSNTPSAIVGKLYDDIAKAIADTDYKSQLYSRGLEAPPMTLAETAEFLNRDYRRSKSLIERLGLSLD
jgi:tripartite-type tricarboxylate transporter receptor subunit TctC